MLNWRLEEKKYIEKAIDEFNKSKGNLYYLFCSDKQHKKNIENVTTNAILSYREEKLMMYEFEIQEERERIDELIKDINKKFEEYMDKIGAILLEKEIVKLEARECDGLEYKIDNKELVNIYIDNPFSIAFFQEIMPKE